MRCLRAGAVNSWVERLAIPGEGPAISVAGTPAIISIVGSESTLAMPVAPGELELVTASPLAVGWWDLEGETVRVDAVDGTTAYLRAGTVERHQPGVAVAPLTILVAAVAPASNTAITIERSSDVRSEAETALSWATVFRAPSILDEVPRLRQLAIGRRELADLPQEAVDDLRGRLYADGLVLDGCTEPGRCLPYLRAAVLLRAAELGADVYGGDYDRQQQIESLQRQLAREWQNLSRLPIFPRLSDGARPRSGWRVTW